MPRVQFPAARVVRELGERYETGASVASLARAYGLSRAAVVYFVAVDKRRRGRHGTTAERIAADDAEDARMAQYRAVEAVMEPRRLRYAETFGALPGLVRHLVARIAEERWGTDGRWPTLEQVHQLSDAELLGHPGFGTGSLLKLRAWLDAHPAPPPRPMPWWVAEE